jgi:hypothetical protein
MVLTPEEQEKFAEAAAPLMKWLSENSHPHTTAIVTATSAELVEGIATHRTDKYVSG